MYPELTDFYVWLYATFWSVVNFVYWTLVSI